MLTHQAFRVLLVEPDDDFRYIFEVLLGTLGYSVATVASAYDALIVISEFAPDAVVTELNIKGVSGLELAAEIRSMPSNENVALIALTGFVKATSENQALKQGFDYFLSKPVTSDRIVAVLDTVAKIKGFERNSQGSLTRT